MDDKNHHYQSKEGFWIHRGITNVAQALERKGIIKITKIRTSHFTHDI